MLGKLMKYEIKATARTFLIMFAAIISLSVINRLLMSDTIVSISRGGDNWIYNLMLGFMIFLYVASIVGTLLAVMILMVMRFYKSLLGDEGYLSFSLPVKPWQHLVSKMLTGSIWLAAGTVTILASVFIMISHPDILSSLGRALNSFFREIWPHMSQYLDYRFNLLIAEFSVMLFAGLLCAFLPLFTAIMIGQLWQKHRVLGAVGAYIGMGFISQIVNSIATGVLIASTPALTVFPNHLNVDQWIDHSFQMGNLFLLTFLIISIIFNAGYFLLSNYLMKNRLNLE